VALVVLAIAAYAANRLRPGDVRIGIDGGVVSIALNGSQHRFDLTNPATELRIQGTPDDADWQVHFLRRTLPPLVVDARMVDPVSFTSALRKWRPEL
jgi:type II secretory pathway component PulK